MNNTRPRLPHNCNHCHEPLNDRIIGYARNETPVHSSVFAGGWAVHRKCRAEFQKERADFLLELGKSARHTIEKYVCYS